MSKTLKKIYYCSNCGANSPKWIGKCPSCEEWNTYQEEIIQKPSEKSSWKNSDKKAVQKKSTLLQDVSPSSEIRILTSDLELNRALGGGIVRGSISLIAGQPGIGKSTLMLQIALSLPGIPVLYASGEESEEQIKMRAERLGFTENVIYLISETKIETILYEAAAIGAGMVIIDSIQTMESPHLDSAPGTISQIRECTAELLRFAKETKIPVFIIGHITKEGDIAGPKLLEHMVDTVLQFEGDRHYAYRILRTLKNRFGSTDEMGIYEMQSTGLRQVNNPSEWLISQHDEQLSGTAIAATMEGQRPLMIETQALVSSTIYGIPQRTATGYDLRRLSMLLAVLEKRCGFYFSKNDVFLNLAGGIKVNDPAVDLAIVASLISSLEDIAIRKDIAFAAEVGLSGEIRAVARIEARIQEAERLGFKGMCISKYNMKGLDTKRFKIKIAALAHVNEMYEKVFKK